jgi:hypothetical protein
MAGAETAIIAMAEQPREKRIQDPCLAAGQLPHNTVTLQFGPCYAMLFLWQSL